MVECSPSGGQSPNPHHTGTENRRKGRGPTRHLRMPRGCWENQVPPAVSHHCLQCCPAGNPFFTPQPGRGPLKKNKFEPSLKHLSGSFLVLRENCTLLNKAWETRPPLSTPASSLPMPHISQHCLVKPWLWLSCRMALLSLPLLGLCIIVPVIYKALTKCQAMC